jgi:hypothetical protein
MKFKMTFEIRKLGLVTSTQCSFKKKIKGSTYNYEIKLLNGHIQDLKLFSSISLNFNAPF